MINNTTRQRLLAGFLMVASCAFLSYFFVLNIPPIPLAGISPALYSSTFYTLAALGGLAILALLLKICLPKTKTAWFWGMLAAIAMIVISSLLLAHIGFSAIPLLPSVIATASMILLYMFINLFESPQIRRVLSIFIALSSTILTIYLLSAYHALDHAIIMPLSAILMFAVLVNAINAWTDQEQKQEQEQVPAPKRSSDYYKGQEIFARHRKSIPCKKQALITKVKRILSFIDLHNSQSNSARYNANSAKTIADLRNILLSNTDHNFEDLFFNIDDRKEPLVSTIKDQYVKAQALRGKPDLDKSKDEIPVKDIEKTLQELMEDEGFVFGVDTNHPLNGVL